ncbi:hypothetical protein AB0F13_14560 [Streptomyces sp. NPDC026206]|uniref:hypothetical protein n=1 Tax=Streptomyces sp. NPDC026206 TaxID=3157089 RepID=UPI0033C28815
MNLLDRHAAYGLIGGLVSYCALSALYDQFYGAFGLTATDMGIGYLDTLSRSWGFILLITLAVALYVFTLSGMGLPISRKRAHNYRNRSKSARWVNAYMHFAQSIMEWIRRNLGVVAAIVAAFALFIALSASSSAVDDRAAATINGNAIKPLQVKLGNHGLRIIFLDIHSHHVRMITPAPTPGSVPCCKHLMHLGSSDRTYILYCVDNKRVIRLSIERYVVHTSP